MTFSEIEEFSFSSEDQLANACSGALRKVKSLSEQAPLGRLFAAISTLEEVTYSAHQSLVQNDLNAAGAELANYAQPLQAGMPLTAARRLTRHG